MKSNVDGANLGESLKGKTGRRYWKSLEQLAGTPEFQKWVDDEFPHRSTLLKLDRRELLKFMGAGMMLAGLAASGCRKLPEHRVVPFIAGPEDYVPGMPVYYASIATMGGYATGVRVKTHEGRPIKLDGNPNHPASLGSLDARTQAQVLDLYDPDRLRMPTYKGDPASWSEFLAKAGAKLTDLAPNSGAGVVLVTQMVGSPTLYSQIQNFLIRHPAAQWVQYEAASRRNMIDGAAMALSPVTESHFRFDLAKVVVSLDSNVMMEGPAAARYQRDIMAGRDLGSGRTEMNRVYAVECAPTTLGVIADHRLPLRASLIPAFTRALAARLGVAGIGAAPAPAGVDENWLGAMARDLAANRGASVVVTGDHQPGTVHALVHAINQHLGNFGTTVVHTNPVLPKPTAEITALGTAVEQMKAGQVQMVLVLGGNPVYDSPADIDFKGGLDNVGFTAHLAMHDDETSGACQWRLPLSHFLEAWGDGRAFDGTASIQQPTILPLYDSKSEIEFFESLIGGAREGIEIVQDYWRGAMGESGFDVRWHTALGDGVIAGTQLPAVQSQVLEGLGQAIAQMDDDVASGNEVVIQPDPTVFDGRFANNGWLQELPKPISNLTWDNAAYMNHETARKIGVEINKKYGFIPADREADMVQITVDGRTVEAAVYVNHGMADGVVLLHLGYGRTRGGKVLLPLRNRPEDHGGGFDAYRLFRSGKNPWMVVNGARFEMAGKTYPLANSQFHNTIDMTKVDSDREILEETTLSAFLSAEPVEHHENPTLYDEDMASGVIGRPNTSVEDMGWNDPNQYQWAMTIDLTLCTGCNACVVACQSENNIPTVGKYQVQRGREMHWIRIDRYYAGEGEESEWPVKDPVIRLQPVTCMQCENAPCEPVCPVAATVHSKEGLNQMVYNRCVGTRYCSNNCPYKVRRFNFLNYANHDDVPVKTLLNNPDVTVRGRGVMEKCTYCVQRINHSRIEAKKRGDNIKDGEVTTACMDACPSRAIVFGNKSDETSRVSKMLHDKRSYKLLDHHLNTKPRTVYLARVTNPNQEIEA